MMKRKNKMEIISKIKFFFPRITFSLWQRKGINWKPIGCRDWLLKIVGDHIGEEITGRELRESLGLRRATKSSEKVSLFFFFFPSFFLSLFYSKSEIWIFVILYRWAEWGRVVRSHPDPTGAADTFSSYTPPFYLSIININTTSFHA